MSIPGIKVTQSVLYLQTPKIYPQDLENLVSRAFAEFDKNESGKLDSRELTAFLGFAVKNGLIEPAKQNLFYEYVQRIDTNRDGLVTKEELLQFFKKLPQKTSPHTQNTPTMPSPITMGNQPSTKKYSDTQLTQIVEQAFRRYDFNHTGQMDYYQLKQYLAQEWGNRYSYFEVKKIADQDGNGLIGKQELFLFLRAVLGPAQ